MQHVDADGRSLPKGLNDISIKLFYSYYESESFTVPCPLQVGSSRWLRMLEATVLAIQFIVGLSRISVEIASSSIVFVELLSKSWLFWIESINPTATTLCLRGRGDAAKIGHPLTGIKF